ncbi:putative ENTH/VHS/GAT family protein [Hibiscus syriacus]|uniref:ENTH/VHS/GAT family protein n=2 Tax=Hibiscus syriacus TaxID=106335 RepID=A0A6A2YBA2_HIBSY|nr:putative ENTH/VHS/GAT family protein [Hibiscus syriacus]
MKKQASPAFTSSTPLFPVFVFLLFIPSFHARNLQQCSSSCGDLKNISYPFRLQGDPAGCGDFGFQLSCQNNAAVLNLRGGKYYVKGISYYERTIRVVDANLANGSCALPYRSLSMEQATEDGRFPSLITFWQANFFNCSGRIPELEVNRVPCLSGNAFHVYVNFSNRNLLATEIPGTCRVISRVPTSSENELNYAYETTLKLLASGFDLRWSVECRDCHTYGYSCVYRSNNDPRIFKCETIYEEDYGVQLAFIISYLVSNSIIHKALVVRFIFLPLVVFAFLLHKCLTTRKTVVDAEKLGLNRKISTPKRYSYTEILAMTNNLEHRLGQGEFGSVYKGQLLPKGCLVAVRLLAESKISEENFINQVSSLGKIEHASVVKLVGFCSQGSKRALVYDYMPNGSLDKHIFSDSVQLSWGKLHEVGLGIAQGIEFLHTACATCVGRLDIKPRNVLLDQNFVPKITDFFLAKLYSEKYDSEHMAPELISRDYGAVSGKTDVYSFGMLLLEMAGRRRNVSESISWFYDQVNDVELENATMQARKMLVVVGLWCIQTNASDRPSITGVVEMLRGKFDDQQMPPKPVSVSAHGRTGELQSDSPKQLLIPMSTERSA